VVALDDGGGVAVDGDALDDVGIEGALARNSALPTDLSESSKTSMKVLPMILRFSLGVVTP
jgi:hypothetical protein